jgi:hypothetical protein
MIPQKHVTPLMQYDFSGLNYSNVRTAANTLQVLDLQNDYVMFRRRSDWQRLSKKAFSPPRLCPQPQQEF